MAPNRGLWSSAGECQDDDERELRGLNELLAARRNAYRHQKSPSVSPPPMLLSAVQVIRSMLFVTNRTEPSHRLTSMPLGCRLRVPIKNVGASFVWSAVG